MFPMRRTFLTSAPVTRMHLSVFLSFSLSLSLSLLRVAPQFRTVSEEKYVALSDICGSFPCHFSISNPIPFHPPASTLKIQCLNEDCARSQFSEVAEKSGEPARCGACVRPRPPVAFPLSALLLRLLQSDAAAESESRESLDVVVLYSAV